MCLTRPNSAAHGADSKARRADGVAHGAAGKGVRSAPCGAPARENGEIFILYSLSAA